MRLVSRVCSISRRRCNWEPEKSRKPCTSRVAQMLNRRIRRRRSSVGMLAFPRGGDCFFASLARSVGEEPVSRCETVLPRTWSGAAGRSVHRVAQTLARLEARQAGGGDLQGGAGLRVAAFAGGAFLDGEGTEAD